ncbi:hypothetical protein Taro_038324 [Colocasia esculenta]|uniref:glucan endo-1,3-beta-D-glucosidase n=1 Tax=Colocasia esculenta TaxID=4460 RepID=A0A843WIX0_COLES|nr:hypothetical protein [Colocasia esculenta]
MGEAGSCCCTVCTMHTATVTQVEGQGGEGRRTKLGGWRGGWAGLLGSGEGGWGEEGTSERGEGAFGVQTDKEGELVPQKEALRRRRRWRWLEASPVAAEDCESDTSIIFKQLTQKWEWCGGGNIKINRKEQGPPLPTSLLLCRPASVPSSPLRPQLEAARPAYLPPAQSSRLSVLLSPRETLARSSRQLPAHSHRRPAPHSRRRQGRPVLVATAVVISLLVWLGAVTGSYVGINIGTDSSNLPPAVEIVSILRDQGIRHVRLFYADHQLLNALANTGIEVVVGIPNDQILRIGQSRTGAAEWVKNNIATFVPATNITHIAVGSEVLTAVPNAALVLIPALQFLHSALVTANLNFQVKVSTPHSMAMIPKPFPPSTAAFNSTWNTVMFQLLQFLKNTGSSFMLNAHPYYGYTQGNGIFPLDYALFRSLTPNNQIVDPNTLSHYSNMFDAMVDAAYYSMQTLNFSGIPVLVTETGWPWLGGPNEPDATVDNALAYNTNLVQHVLSGVGTPSHQNNTINTYIYELFNEDLRPGPVSEKNWGLFFPNGTAVYSVNFMGNREQIESNSSGLAGFFCVANSSSDPRSLKTGLDWACGSGSANCSAIQPGQPCYESDNIAAIASYAYNDYYHKTQSIGGSCNFGNTAFITTTDPNIELPKTS